MKILKFLDMIGPQPSLFIDSSERSRSILGGIFTIISFLISILFFILFGLDMLNKENPVLYEYRVFNATSQIDFEQIPFVINVQRPGGFKINDLLRKVRVYMRFAITNTSDTQQPTKYKFADFTSCTSKDFFKKNLFNIKGSLNGGEENALCLPDDFQESIIGQFGNPYFRLSQVVVSFCNNATTNNTCLPRSEIEKDLATFFAQYIFLDNYFDLADYKNPIKQYWRSDLLQLSSKSYLLNQYQMKISNLKTDDGLIFENNNFKYSFQFDSKTSIPGSHPDFFLVVQTFISNINFFSVRKYMKLQNVIASTGGIIKFFTLIFTAICKYFNNFNFIESIYIRAYNQYYNFYNSYDQTKSPGLNTQKFNDKTENYNTTRLKNNFEKKLSAENFNIEDYAEKNKIALTEYQTNNYVSIKNDSCDSKKKKIATPKKSNLNYAV